MKMDELKRNAAEEAAKRIENGQRIGLGTGSTVQYFLEALSRRLLTGELTGVVGVPTSLRTDRAARALGIPITSLETDTGLDVTVDGADEVDSGLNLIKGLGGAFLREKIVAFASRRFIGIVDKDKLVPQLGTRAPVPVEVLPFGWKATAEKIEVLGGKPSLREEKGSAVVTDQENHILDCRFGLIRDPANLARQLDAIPGVMGHGLFLNIADEVIVGTDGGTEVHTR